MLAAGSKCGVNGQNTHRPRMTSSAGRSVVIATNAVAMPTAATGPRLRVELRSAASRQSIPVATVVADARRAGNALRGAPHRDVPILVTMQLLAIARDEEECVVRTDAEDQHREDADALRIDHQSDAIGEQPDDGVGQHIGKPNDEQREQPEHGTAVRQQQDHGDDNDGRDEQGRLDTVGTLIRDRPRRRRVGDEDVQPRRRTWLHDVAQRLDIGGQRLVVIGKWDDEQQRFSVWRCCRGWDRGNCEGTGG